MLACVEDHRARLLRAIRTSDRLLDDDELAQRAGIAPRQTVNQVLRRLEREGAVRRMPGPAGKLVTELVPELNTPSGDDLGDQATAVEEAGVEGARATTAGSSVEQRRAETAMLAIFGERLGLSLAPARLSVDAGVRVEVDGADRDRSVLVECWAHQGPPKVGQKHKVLTDALKLTWIASRLPMRPRLYLCLSDPLAAAPFRAPSRSWAAQALRDLDVQIEIVELPEELRQAVVAAQARQYR